MTIPETCRIEDGPAHPDRVVLVPGQAAPLVAFDLPDALRGQAREQVARRWVKDRLGLDPDTTILRPFDPGAPPDRWRRALVVDADRIAAWQALPARALLPDYLALPAADGLWTVGPAQDDAVSVRLGPWDGFTAGAEAACLMLDRALEAGPAPRAVWLAGAVPSAVADWCSAHGLSLSRPEAPGDVAPPRVFAHDELTADLRRNPGALRARLATGLRPWRFPTVAGLLAAGLFAAAQIEATRQIGTVTDALRDETRAAVRAHFVPTGPILDTRLQVARALAARKAGMAAVPGDDAPDLVRRAAQAIDAGRARPLGLTVTAGQDLRAVLMTDDFAHAARLIDAFRARGLAADLGETAVSDGGVRAVYVLRPGSEP